MSTTPSGRARPRGTRPVWRGQRPWFEIWFAVLLDASRRRALWVRQDLFIPRSGEGRATIWGAWFDADADAQARAAKRSVPIQEAKLDEGDRLIQIDDAWMTHDAAHGSVEGLAWDVAWAGGRDAHAEVPTWVPAPTHAAPIVSDADATGQVTAGGQSYELRGCATAMHLWGKRRVPTLQWIWSPWTGASALELQAVSLFDSFALGLSMLRLEGPGERLRGRPRTRAHASCLVSSTITSPRRLVHVRAWAEPAQMVGYAYRDVDGRDLLVAQSDIGSAHHEVFTRKAPGMRWRLTDERRTSGGVAVELHQRAPLPEVEYIAWDDTTRRPHTPPPRAVRADEVAWPEVTAIVALGLTYDDHLRETGQQLAPGTPPMAFPKHLRTLAPGDGAVRVPDAGELLAALDELEPGLAASVAARISRPPAVMDYEGELALVALGPIDDARLAEGVPQPLGLAAANDLTARIVQVLGHAGKETTDRTLDYWARAKSFAGFLPVAPRVWAPPGGLATMPELTLETRVNGEVRQHATTKLLIYDLIAIVRAARARLGRPLVRGDVILTGTPAGIGLRMSPLKRKVAALVKDRLRKAELLVSTYATSTTLLRPGDLIEVDAGPAGRVRTRLTL